MCKHCVATEVIGDGIFISHIGYSESINDDYEKLLHGDIVIEQQNTQRKKLPQKDIIELWNTLCNKHDIGNVDTFVSQEHNKGCAVPDCGEKLITVPGVGAECIVCGIGKHETITRISESRSDIADEMKQFFGESGPGDGKINDPIELAIRAGLQCPTGHWICSNCLTYKRDQIEKP